MATSADHSNLYAANQPYNQSVAYRPHATIPEPAEFNSENGFLQLTCRPFELTCDTYGNPELLRTISSMRLQPVANATTKYGWKYDSRRKAQAIMPFLYLGPAPVARDPGYIAENNISMVIAVRSAQSAKALPKWLDPSRFPSCANLQTATFDVDSPLDLIARIKPILKLMTDHLDARTTDRPIHSLEDIGGRILVFCESGNERSPVLVAAYLMLVYGISWSESLNFIHAHRFSVGLNVSMNEMLRTLEGMFKAEADTAAAMRGAGASATLQNPANNFKRISKRSIDNAYDPDEIMSDEIEVAFRPGIAPFIDKS